MVAALLAEPRWRSAARALVSGCLDLHHDEDRVALLTLVCRGLGDELYPALLRVLAEVSRHGDHDARAAVARALVRALCSGRLPAARRTAWGGVDDRLRSRSLGPLEYLCAWASQGDADGELPVREFEAAAQAVMTLVESDAQARLLYCAKLQADAQDPLEGTLSRATRAAMLVLSQAWATGAAPAEACARFTESLSASGLRSTLPALARTAAPQRSSLY